VIVDTEEQVRRSGYVVLPNSVRPGLVTTLRRQVDRHAASLPTGEFRIDGAVERLDLLDQLRAEETLVKSVQGVLGEDVCILLNRHNHVTVDCGSGLRSGRMHRDARQWGRSYLTLLIPVNGTGGEHAATKFIPGSHHWATAGRCNGGGYWLDEGPYDGMEAQAVRPELGIGDAMLLDPYCFHAAGQGLPDLPRTMLCLAVAPLNDLLEEIPDSEVVWCGEHRYVGQAGWRER
jgi:hypothetical protein